jgi:8-oxo-dGTP pyrophosphatase MutT (NUDIX family)
MSRDAVRVVVFDQDDRLLLVRFHDGDRSWWCCPGGGIEDRESDDEAARRELVEEVGLSDIELGPCIWSRHHIGVYQGQPFDQRERYYVSRTAHFEPSPAPGRPVEHGREDIRWWSLHDIAVGEEQFTPRRLAALVNDLLEEGPPERPFDAGV